MFEIIVERAVKFFLGQLELIEYAKKNEIVHSFLMIYRPVVYLHPCAKSLFYK